MIVCQFYVIVITKLQNKFKISGSSIFTTTKKSLNNLYNEFGSINVPKKESYLIIDDFSLIVLKGKENTFKYLSICSFLRSLSVVEIFF